MTLFLLLLMAQTPPPCPPSWNVASCIICQDLFVNAGIPYEDCPCNDENSIEFNTIPNVEGSCCFITACVEFDCEAPCIDAGGQWQPLGDCVSMLCGAVVAPDIQACCISDPYSFTYCVDTTLTGCNNVSGVWQPNDTCSLSLCGAIFEVEDHGLCCYVDDTGLRILTCVTIGTPDDLFSLTNPECSAWGGDFYFGADCSGIGGLDCSFIECEDDGEIEFACCIGTSCSEITANECTNAGGVSFGGMLCVDVDCDDNGGGGSYGACCVGSICITVWQNSCYEYVNGIWLGAGSTCAGVVCDDDGGGDPVGACCIPSSMAGASYCATLTAQLCANNSGQWLGAGTTCVGNPCDDGGGETYGACCFSDGSCSVITELACFEGGGNFVGGQCLFGTCSGYDKLCECILLEAILENNRRILLEMLDQGYTLDQSLFALNLIQENTYNTVGLLTIQAGLMDRLVNEQFPDLMTLLENTFDPSGADNDVDKFADFSQQFADAGTNFSGQSSAFEGMFDQENDSFGLGAINLDAPATAPQFIVSGGLVSVSLLGQNTVLNQAYVFDFGLLEDWGVRTIVRVVVLLICGWWAVVMIWQETRKQ